MMGECVIYLSGMEVERKFEFYWCREDDESGLFKFKKRKSELDFECFVLEIIFYVVVESVVF